MPGHDIDGAVLSGLVGTRRGAGGLGAAGCAQCSHGIGVFVFFYALKHLEPAIASALQIGVGPLLAAGFALLRTGRRPSRARLGVCLGVLLGCAILAWAALDGRGFAGHRSAEAGLGLAASVATGVGALSITLASQGLLARGWSSGAVLAHRFYLAVPVALGLALAGGDLQAMAWTPQLLAGLLAVALLGTLLPLYLLQMGLGRCDAHTVMVSMAALPVLSFMLGLCLPQYAWSWGTALGVAVVTASLLADLLVARRGALRGAAG